MYTGWPPSVASEVPCLLLMKYKRASGAQVNSLHAATMTCNLTSSALQSRWREAYQWGRCALGHGSWRVDVSLEAFTEVPLAVTPWPVLLPWQHSIFSNAKPCHSVLLPLVCRRWSGCGG